jgi:hypothetical protein
MKRSGVCRGCGTLQDRGNVSRDSPPSECIPSLHRPIAATVFESGVSGPSTGSGQAPGEIGFLVIAIPGTDHVHAIE